MRDETPMGTVPFTGYPPARTAQQARRNGCRRTRPMTSGTLCGIGSSLLLQYGPSGQAGRDDVAETSGGGLAEMAIVRIVGRRPFFGDGEEVVDLDALGLRHLHGFGVIAPNLLRCTDVPSGRSAGIESKHRTRANTSSPAHQATAPSSRCRPRQGR